MHNTRATPDEQAPETQAIGEAEGLHVRQVEDRGLPAAVVLPEVNDDRGPQGPVPVFVP